MLYSCLDSLSLSTIFKIDRDNSLTDNPSFRDTTIAKNGERRGSIPAVSHCFEAIKQSEPLEVRNNGLSASVRWPVPSVTAVASSIAKTNRGAAAGGKHEGC